MGVPGPGGPRPRPDAVGVRGRGEVSTGVVTGTIPTHERAPDLARLLCPGRVAVVGASGTPGKWGTMMLRVLLDGGFAGEVVAVNGRGGEVQGCRAYRTVADLPWAPDVALLAVGREAAVEAVEALAARGCAHAIVYAAGFAEVGPEGAALQARIVTAARAGGMRLLGPNCMSLYVARSRLNLTGIPDLAPGRLAFVSQSGNLVYDLVEHGRASGLGLSVFASVGNQADLGLEDFFDELAVDPDTGAVAIYVEAIRPCRGRAFLEGARRLSAVKPVVALVGGRTAAGRQAAASHTASLVSDTRLLRGLLRQAGVVEVERLDELFPVADALLKCPLPPVPTVAVCGGGGGHATVATDALERRDVGLPAPSPETQAALRANFPPMASVRNPMDWTGASERSFWAYHDAARLLLADPGLGGVILFGHFGGYLLERETPENNYADVARALGALQLETGKPVFVHSIYVQQPRVGFEALREAGVPLFGSLEVAAAAYRALIDHARLRARGPLPPGAGRDDDDRLAPWARAAQAEGRLALLEPEALAWLTGLGLPLPQSRWAHTAEEAVTFAATAGGPVALKVVSAAILHKSDVGGVRLDLRDPAAVREGFAALKQVAAARGADFRGALVVPMAPPGVEVAIGAVRTDLGGHALLFGAGGTGIEALDDASVRPVPLARDDAVEMVAETRVGRLIRASRGMAPPPLEPLYDLMVAVGAAVPGSNLLAALDLNPVRLTAAGPLILDARVLLAPSADGGAA